MQKLLQKCDYDIEKAQRGIVYIDEVDKISRKSVLGIDMYQYSSLGEFEQTLVPFLFKAMFESTIKLCLTNHRFIFQKYSKNLNKLTFS